MSATISDECYDLDYETRSVGRVTRDLYKWSRGRITPKNNVAQSCLTTVNRAKPPYHQLGAYGPLVGNITVSRFLQLLNLLVFNGTYHHGRLAIF